jgi:beta-lactamase regulating signal transducer with metallopeptidase domain
VASWHEGLAVLSSVLWPRLLNHLWQATLFAVGIMVAVRLVRLQHRARYVLYVVAGAAFLLPSAALAPLVRRALPAPAPVREVLSTDDAGEVLSRIASPVAELAVARGPIASDTGKHDETGCVLTLLWGLGFVTSLGVWLGRLRGRSRWRRHARGASLREDLALQRAAQCVSTRCDVDLRISPVVPEPAVQGLWRPVILLPEGLPETLDDEEMIALLVHEMLHVRRRDNLAACVQKVVGCLLWFHPVVWWLERRLQAEREMRCDEGVLERTRDVETYAAALLKTVRFCLQGPVPGVSYASKTDLQRRVADILGPRPATGWWQRLAVPSAVGALAAFSIGMALLASAAERTPTAETSADRGRGLAADAVARLEQRLLTQPADLLARQRLLVHYSSQRSPQAKAAEARHALWVITNAPESDVAGRYAPPLGWSAEDERRYEDARRLWRRQVQAQDANPKVLANAAAFFGPHDRTLAIKLLERARELDPHDPQWSERLARMYRMQAEMSAQDPVVARKSLAQYEAAIEMQGPAATKPSLLGEAAGVALVSGEDGKAADYAAEMLLRTPGEGTAAREAHRVLGHVALKAGDLDQARTHLRESAGASVPSDDDLTLANALLAKGEREAVVEYLQALVPRSDAAREQIVDWIILIRAGRTPVLDRHAIRATSHR